MKNFILFLLFAGLGMFFAHLAINIHNEIDLYNTQTDDLKLLKLDFATIIVFGSGLAIASLWNLYKSICKFFKKIWRFIKK